MFFFSVFVANGCWFKKKTQNKKDEKYIYNYKWKSIAKEKEVSVTYVLDTFLIKKEMVKKCHNF